MKRTHLKEILKNESLREGLVDIILKKIGDKKIKANKKDMIDILKGIYGSEDKIPDWRKKHLGL
jgi:uridine kinase